ncbi:hypothetical protein PO397_19440 [Bacteroides ovatus]|uniref:hypothetical protein n=1 Tax=Bacteroides ovatus TaxID=28116 RepID=UPI0018A02412|nr:hypothetical protein [Bacteroides ovatus]MDC2773765.1 hypothetical protein [Bacteroides ovatus]MDC2783161.1 hypothetical protein [Bacteroides ovatus]MDC2787991.1 hypothetical protein [Bacteroides ovatus]MDC2793590.1 hypothetical protein [Bacteroides ovatus]MDC2798530.1 hypothetical protein [Bacteroides ovatus]
MVVIKVVRQIVLMYVRRIAIKVVRQLAKKDAVKHVAAHAKVDVSAHVKKLVLVLVWRAAPDHVKRHVIILLNNMVYEDEKA